MNEMKNGESGENIVSDVRVKDRKIIEHIIENIFISKKELGVTIYPSEGYFKSYLLEIKPDFLLIDSLMPFYGNKIISKSEFIKVEVATIDNSIERYFFTKYEKKIADDENDLNFLVVKPIEIVLIEKRAVLRVSTNQSNTAFISFSYNSQNYYMPVHDISWNNISFNSEVEIKVGHVIKKATIKFSKKQANANLRVIHSTYMEGQYRIGCTITDISNNDRDKLINFMLGIERQNLSSNLN